MSNGWTPRLNSNGVQYPARYWWDPNINPNATFGNCLANCTTYAYGRVIENGNPPPTNGIWQANYWHNNVANGWVAIPFDRSRVKPGDILEWSSIHVAVVEYIDSDGGIMVSESNYTGNNGQAYAIIDGERTFSPRTHAVMGNSLQSVSNWMFRNYPDRTWRLRKVWSATWILVNPETSYQPGPPGPPEPQPSGQEAIWTLLVPILKRKRKKGGMLL